MFALYIGQSKLEYLKSVLNQKYHSPSYDSSDQVMLLSSRMLEHFANGGLSLKASPSESTSSSAEYFAKKNIIIPSEPVDVFPLVKLENRATGLASLPDLQLLEVHRRFAQSFAWLEVSEYMGRAHKISFRSQTAASLISKIPTNRSWLQRCMQSMSSVFTKIWLQTPVFLRACTYSCLTSLSRRFYESTGSDQIYRLPFNLYLRKAYEDWAPKHQAEFQALRMVQQYTHIPAPRGIDVIQYRSSSYLLMTGVPGRGIGQMLHTMTDKQLDLVAQDLRDYTTELRQIPNKTGSEFLICNTLGGGILDWRIGDSQRKELKFRSVNDFNKFLIDDLPIDKKGWKLIDKAHSAKHDTVFTHADLNLRNILVDDTGRISAIVDWECAGWYPEYWEYTKMHFTVRFTPRWLVDVVDQIFPNYSDELRVEDMLAAMAPPW